MANIIRYSFERYENKYFLTPAQYAHIIEDIRPYVKEDDYSRYIAGDHRGCPYFRLGDEYKIAAKQ